MTVEELKIEAGRLGYRLVKKPERITMLPCPICGKKNTSEWQTYAEEYDGSVFFRACNVCFFRGFRGNTSKEARKKWNEAVLNFEKKAHHD